MYEIIITFKPAKFITCVSFAKAKRYPKQHNICWITLEFKGYMYASDAVVMWLPRQQSAPLIAFQDQWTYVPNINFLKSVKPNFQGYQINEVQHRLLWPNQTGVPNKCINMYKVNVS